LISLFSYCKCQDRTGTGSTIPFRNGSDPASRRPPTFNKASVKKFEQGIATAAGSSTRAKDCSPGRKVACRDMVQGARWEIVRIYRFRDEKSGIRLMRMLLPACNSGSLSHLDTSLHA
jgi:hypothetical protein